MRQIRLKKSILLPQWKGSPPEYVRASQPNSHPNARFLNIFLNNELNRAERIILNAEIENQYLSFEDFKRLFLKTEEMDFFQWHRNYTQHRMNVGAMKESTLARYESQFNKLSLFATNLKLSDITFDFVSRYNTFLTEKLDNSHNTRQKSIAYLKSIFEYAKRKGAISGDPFAEINLAPKYPPRTFLLKSEVDLLINLYQSHSLKAAYQHVLKKFLWCCHTGQGFTDMMETKYEDIIEIVGHKCLTNRRIKTDRPYFVPLMPVALELIMPFPEDLTTPLFQTMSNQKYNTTIREIVKIVGIKKHITSHVARHTCGHLFAAVGISRDFIKEMLGHSRIDQTQHYSQVMPEDLIRQIKDRFQ